MNQPEFTPSGTPTQKGKFYQAALAHRQHSSAPHAVRVYEKIQQGVWSYNGIFHLVDAWKERDRRRTVFKFKLVAVQDENDSVGAELAPAERRRLIPTAVKVEVWNRDRGRCVICGASDELHFDHVLPFSKGGTSLKAENVQLLCARHNLSKGARIS